jgi:hypothetical protein
VDFEGLIVTTLTRDDTEVTKKLAIVEKIEQSFVQFFQQWPMVADIHL